jgi:hypothetical protein
MSLLRQSDYLQESKKNKTVSPRRGSHGGISTSTKVSLPTQHKTQRHKCSQCIRNDAKKYQLTQKECRWLCPVCFTKNKNKDSHEKPHFISAKKLWRQS